MKLEIRYFGAGGEPVRRIITGVEKSDGMAEALARVLILGMQRRIQTQTDIYGDPFKPLRYSEKWHAYRPPVDMDGVLHSPEPFALFDRGVGFRTLNWQKLSDSSFIVGTPLLYMALQNSGFVGVLPPEYEDHGRSRKIGPRRFIGVDDEDRAGLSEGVHIETLRTVTGAA